MSWYKRASSKIMLDFPTEVQQRTEYTCGVAALQSVLGYYGVLTHENQVREAVNANPETGTEEENVIAVAHKLGFKAKMQSMTAEGVRKYLLKHIPVILVIQAWSDEPVDYGKSTKQGHYVVAIGIDQHNMYFHDPVMTRGGYIPLDQLDRRWHTEDHEHLGIVIFPASSKLNQV